MSDEAPNYDEIDRLEIERLIVDDLGCGSPQDARYKLDMITRKLAAVTAELDALRKDNARLRGAAEIGLEYAKGDLAQRKESFAGYPKQWEAEERDVATIEAALRGEERQP